LYLQIKLKNKELFLEIINRAFLFFRIIRVEYYQTASKQKQFVLKSKPILPLRTLNNYFRAYPVVDFQFAPLYIYFQLNYSEILYARNRR